MKLAEDISPAIQSSGKGFFYNNPNAYQLVIFTFQNKKAQDKYWKARRLEGAPTVLLSSFPSLLAINGSSASVHNPKHSAHAFVLDETVSSSVRYDHTARSTWWERGVFCGHQRLALTKSYGKY